MVDAEDISKLLQMQSSIQQQIDEVEAEILSLYKPVAKGTKLEKTHSTRVVPTSSLAPHWEQVITLVKQGQDEEAIYALVRVVQRILDEKAFSRALSEKANKSYVDSLFDIMASGVNDTLEKCTQESISELSKQIKECNKKVGGLRKYMQMQLSEIQQQISQLKVVEQTDENEKEEEPDQPINKSQQIFIVHPHRQNR